MLRAKVVQESGARLVYKSGICGDIYTDLGVICPYIVVCVGGGGACGLARRIPMREYKRLLLYHFMLSLYCFS